MQSKIFIGLALILVVIVLNSACGRISFSPENTNSASIEPKENLTDLQREVKAMETADFKIIFVFKRKDGGAFEKEDRDYLRANRPPDVNRWIATDDKTAFIAGSNYEFPLANLELLRKRFIVEDFSKPIEIITVETNTNKKF